MSSVAAVRSSLAGQELRSCALSHPRVWAPGDLTQSRLPASWGPSCVASSGEAVASSTLPALLPQRLPALPGTRFWGLGQALALRTGCGLLPLRLQLVVTSVSYLTWVVPLLSFLPFLTNVIPCSAWTLGSWLPSVRLVPSCSLL